MKRVLGLGFIFGFFLLFLPLIIFAGEKLGGGKIAYSRLADGYWQVWVYDLDKNTHSQLTYSPCDKREPTFSPDGKRIAYRTNNAEVYILDLETGRQQRILKDLGLVSDLDWSPDGSRIIFTRFRSDIKDDSDIFIADEDGKDLKALTNDPEIQCQPVFSPDGRRIVYVDGRREKGYNIAIMDIDGSSFKLLTDIRDYNLQPAWSPDGEKISFSSNRSGSYEIWIMDKQGGGLKQLTKDNGFNSFPRFSPDGRRLAYTSLKGGILEIWVMDLDSGLDRRVSEEGKSSRDPDWLRQ